MIRIFNIYFPSRILFLALTETLVVVFAILPAAYMVSGPGAAEALSYENSLVNLLVVVVVCMICMHYFDLYDSVILYNSGQGITRVIQVLGSACVVLASLYYVYPAVQINQSLLVAWIVLAGISLIVWRRLLLVLNKSARLSQKTLLLGNGPLAAELVDAIELRPELGLRLTGYVAQEPASNGEFRQLTLLGGTEELPALLERHNIQRVIITMENRRGRLPVEPLLAAKAHGVIVNDGPAFYEAIAGRVDLNSLRPTMMLFSEGFRVSPLMMFYKRTASIVLSLMGLILTAPVMAVVAIAIRVNSPGPVVFKQRRAGRDGKPFILYKFRSMYYGADKDGKSKPAQSNDARCTSVGRILRRTRLDELPQLFNILRGDMHFIGPRPFALDMEEELAQKIPFYTKRWTMRPGATGWAQVRQGYNETLEENASKLSYDLYYIKNLSVGLDFVILLETLKILLLGRGGR